METNSSKSQVKFNQAGYQQERINDLMRVVNLCWINPTQFNSRFGDFNYRIIFQVLTSYYTEIRVKLKAERENIDKLMKRLDSYIEANPILIASKKASLYGKTSGDVSFNDKSWRVIKECLLLFQNKILDSAESHGMGNPTKKDITKAAIDL